MLINPITSTKAEITLTGSKSLTNRALLMASLCQGTTKLHNLLNSDDTRHMRVALAQLGVGLKFSADFTNCEVQGNGGIFNPINQEIYLGNAGTAMRFLTAVLCLKGIETNNIILTGDERMQQRPIGGLVNALCQSGAKIKYINKENFPPLCIENSGLIGGDIILDGSISSQFLSALLMASPFSQQDTKITIQGELVSKPYIAMTIRMLTHFGIKLQWHQNDSINELFIPSQQSYLSPKEYWVEGDASTASYFLSAGALAGSVKVWGIGKNILQGDSKFADVLALMGAKITYGEKDGEKFIQAEKPSSGLQGIDLDANDIPDASMTLATLGLFAKSATTIRNVSNWKIKETDRLHALYTELNKIGAKVERGEDWLRVYPLDLQNYQPIPIATYNDHRIAMCFALLSTGGLPVSIQDPNCVSKTCPSFWEMWKKIAN